MSEEKPLYLFPVLSRPDPLAFTVEPLTDEQPSVVAGCGHSVWRQERLVLYGHTVSESNPNSLFALPRWLQRFFAPKQCILCRFKYVFDETIACAYCDGLIFRGDPVSTYFPSGELPEGFQTRATRTLNGYIGCMRWDCCPTTGFFAGHWVGKGVCSPFSRGTAAAQAFHDGEPVFVPDISAL